MGLATKGCVSKITCAVWELINFRLAVSLGEALANLQAPFAVGSEFQGCASSGKETSRGRQPAKGYIPSMLLKVAVIEATGKLRWEEFASATQNGRFGPRLNNGVDSAYGKRMINRNSFLCGAVLGLGLLAFVNSALSANWYVRPSSAGSNSGTDWNNAWNVASFNSRQSSIAAGDTVWIAGGSYTTALVESASGTSGSRIYIKRVTSSDAVPVAAAGWSSSFDSVPTFQVAATGAANQSIITLGGSYVTFDGNVTNGVKVIMGLGAGAAWNAFTTTGNYIVISHTETQGRGVGVTAGATTRYLAMYGQYNTSTYNYVHGVTQAYTLNGSDDMTLDHDTILDNGWHTDVSLYHDDVMEYTGSARLTVRYCHWEHWHAEGIMAWGGFGQAGQITMYGNLFKDTGVSVVWPSNNGQTSAGPLYFYNNTVINGYVCLNQNANCAWAAGSQVRNNIYWGTDVYGGPWNWPISDRDYEFGSTVNLAGSGAHSIANGSTPFVNFAGGDYRIVTNIGATYPRNKGVALNTTYNTDHDGNTRGADGTWDIGAYEYASVSTNPVIVVSPSSRDFASVTVGATSDLTLTVQNSGGGTLSGTASVPVPFSIVAGGTYSLGASQSQTVTVRFSPSAVGNTNGTVTFTGAGGANATVSGIGAAITDPTPPTVTLTGPANGVTVSNKLIMTATASDNVGVLAVAFFVNGTQVSAVASSPYSCTWDSVMFANGTYQVYAQARDAQGNVAWSSTNSVTVNNIVGALPTPAAYWSFNEGAGTAARSSVSTNALTLRSGATWSAAGKDHASLSLDGATGRAEASSSTELGITGTAITVSAWVNLQSQGTWQQIVAKVHEVGASTSPYFSWHLFGAHASSTQWTPQFQLVNSNGVSANVTSSINVNYGQWAHIVGVYDGSAVRIYVNGVDRGSAAQSGNIVDYAQPLYIGASGLPDEFARGLVDEVRVYSVALSAAQVTRIYEIPCNVMVSPISN